ncbi:hypothetical protein C4565_04895 [Candidatus Parcubacteria bacterium]|nr:MAG: hypothetical protein C4565_04895 [Candidatus Parcubacteria bacterium]
MSGFRVASLSPSNLVSIWSPYQKKEYDKTIKHNQTKSACALYLVIFSYIVFHSNIKSLHPDTVGVRGSNPRVPTRKNRGVAEDPQPLFLWF